MAFDLQSDTKGNFFIVDFIEGAGGPWADRPDRTHMRRQNYVRTALLLDGDIWYLAGAMTVLQNHNTPFHHFELPLQGAVHSDQLQDRTRANRGSFFRA